MPRMLFACVVPLLTLCASRGAVAQTNNNCTDDQTSQPAATPDAWVEQFLDQGSNFKIVMIKNLDSKPIHVKLVTFNCVNADFCGPSGAWVGPGQVWPAMTMMKSAGSDDSASWSFDYKYWVDSVGGQKRVQPKNCTPAKNQPVRQANALNGSGQQGMGANGMSTPNVQDDCPGWNIRFDYLLDTGNGYGPEHEEDRIEIRNGKIHLEVADPTHVGDSTPDDPAPAGWRWADGNLATVSVSSVYVRTNTSPVTYVVEVGPVIQERTGPNGEPYYGEEKWQLRFNSRDQVEQFVHCIKTAQATLQR